MDSAIPQDTLPEWLWIPLAAVAWSAVVYIYVWLPWVKNRKNRKLKKEDPS